MSEQAEQATRLLFRTLGAHRTAVANLPPPDPSRRLPGLSYDRKQIQCQATLVRLLSITEAFCAERLLGQVEPLVDPARSKTVSSIWDDAAVNATHGWEDQKRAYKRWLGVSPNWQPVERLAEARNAVAHGLGTLTRRQRRNETSVRDKLSAAGISVVGDVVILSDVVVAAAAATCRDFVEHVDLIVQGRPAD